MNTKRNILALLACAAMTATATPQAVAAASKNVTCTPDKKICKSYRNYKLLSAHVSVIARDIYPGVNPDVVYIKDDQSWHVRFVYKGVLKQLRIIDCYSPPAHAGRNQ